MPEEDPPPVRIPMVGHRPVIIPEGDPPETRGPQQADMPEENPPPVRIPVACPRPVVILEGDPPEPHPDHARLLMLEAALRAERQARAGAEALCALLQVENIYIYICI